MLEFAWFGVLTLVSLLAAWLGHRADANSNFEDGRQWIGLSMVTSMLAVMSSWARIGSPLQAWFQSLFPNDTPGLVVLTGYVLVSLACATYVMLIIVCTKWVFKRIRNFHVCRVNSQGECHETEPGRSLRR